MAKKTDSDSAPDSADAPEIEIPADLIEAVGGDPIPAPRIPRPTVNRVGGPAASKWRDKGGILAGLRPERRIAVARIDKARGELTKLVSSVETQIPKLRAAVASAAESPEIAEQEGFSSDAAVALIDALEATLKKHLA